MSNIVFGECLKLLLSALDISNSRLSKAINVDSSVVNRWIHGKRVPPYHSGYIESISEYLSKNVHNSHQEQQIDSIALDVYLDVNGTDGMKEKIKKILLEAQGYTIECNKKKRKETNLNRSNKGQITEALNRNLINDAITPFIGLSGDDKVVFGTENILSTSFDLLESAINQGYKNNEFIYITYNNFMSSESSSYHYIIQWRNTLLDIINKGWHIIILIRLNGNTTRTVKFINCMIPLVQTGKFMPYYIKNYDSIAIGDELVVVPDIGVLTCFCTSSSLDVNCGFYIKNKPAISIYQRHFQVFLERNALPLVNIFTNRTDYSHYLANSEDNIGNRFLYKYCFSVLTLPEHLYWKFLGGRRRSNDAKVTSMEFYRQRLQAFLSNIQNYEYKDVYMASSIRDLIKNHQFYLYSYEGIESIHMEVVDIIEYLENIINLLLKYDNYNIAFLPDDYNNTNIMESFCCVVKERTTVLFESSDQFTDTEEIHTSITEPTLVKAIYDYFIELWNHIPPANKDKSEVVSWLQDQVNALTQLI